MARLAADRLARRMPVAAGVDVRAPTTAADDGADPSPAFGLEHGLRSRARASRDWATADLIRDRLASAGMAKPDGAEGSSWFWPETAAR